MDEAREAENEADSAKKMKVVYTRIRERMAERAKERKLAVAAWRLR